MAALAHGRGRSTRRAGQLAHATAGGCAVPARRFAAMVFAARTRPDGRAGQQRPWWTTGLSRAEGSKHPAALKRRASFQTPHARPAERALP